VEDTSGRREVEKGHERVNMVQILCTYVCKWKIETCRKYSRNCVGGVMKKNDGGGEFKYDIFFNIARTFVNVTVYPHPAQQFKKTDGKMVDFR
jgi:hypothetical protein